MFQNNMLDIGEELDLGSNVFEDIGNAKIIFSKTLHLILEIKTKDLDDWTLEEIGRFYTSIFFRVP